MNSKVSKKQLKEFGFVIGFGFPVFVGFLLPLIWGDPFRKWTILVGLVPLIFGLLKPNLLLIPYEIWMRIGLYLGWVNSRIVLGIIFILVLVPISLIMKLLRYDPLRIKRYKKLTYREENKNRKIDLKKLF